MAHTPITALPAAPSRTTDTAAEFSTKADAHVAALSTFVTEINTTGVYIDGVAAAVDADKVSSAASVVAAAAEVVNAQAEVVNCQTEVSNAQAIADAVESNLNFKGAWSSQTGAANIPYSVSHNNTYWQLVSNLADVTSSEPGVANDWIPSIGAAVSGDIGLFSIDSNPVGWVDADNTIYPIATYPGIATAHPTWGDLFETQTSIETVSTVTSVYADDTYVYYSIGTNLEIVNKGTFTSVTTIAVGANINAVIVDSNYVYVLTTSSPYLKVYNVGSWGLVGSTPTLDGITSSGAKCDQDATHVFIPMNGTTYEMQAINKTTLLIDANITTGTGTGTCVTNDETYVYLGDSAAPYFRKILKSTWAVEVPVEAPASNVNSIFNDGRFVYISQNNTPKGITIFDKGTEFFFESEKFRMIEDTTLTHIYGDDNFIYARSSSNAIGSSYLGVFRKSDFSLLSTLPDQGYGPYGMAFDSDYIYSTQNISPFLYALKRNDGVEFQVPLLESPVHGMKYMVKE